MREAAFVEKISVEGVFGGYGTVKCDLNGFDYAQGASADERAFRVHLIFEISRVFSRFCGIRVLLSLGVCPANRFMNFLSLMYDYHGLAPMSGGKIPLFG